MFYMFSYEAIKKWTLAHFVKRKLLTQNLYVKVVW